MLLQDNKKYKLDKLANQHTKLHAADEQHNQHARSQGHAHSVLPQKIAVNLQSYVDDLIAIGLGVTDLK